MILWTYIDQYGQQRDIERDTRLEAIHAAEEAFERECGDLAHGDSEEAEIEIISYDTETINNQILTREPYTLFVEGYHGDYAEHNTHWGKL